LVTLKEQVLWLKQAGLDCVSVIPSAFGYAKISEKYWSGIITYRSSKTRIISVRRSRKEEVDIYEGYQG